MKVQVALIATLWAVCHGLATGPIDCDPKLSMCPKVATDQNSAVTEALVQAPPKPDRQEPGTRKCAEEVSVGSCEIRAGCTWESLGEAYGRCTEQQDVMAKMSDAVSAKQDILDDGPISIDAALQPPVDSAGGDNPCVKAKCGGALQEKTCMERCGCVWEDAGCWVSTEGKSCAPVACDVTTEHQRVCEERCSCTWDPQNNLCLTNAEVHACEGISRPLCENTTACAWHNTDDKCILRKVIERSTIEKVLEAKPIAKDGRSNAACVQPFKQCGGEGWSGPEKCCPSNGGFHCTHKNETYSRCEPESHRALDQ